MSRLETQVFDSDLPDRPRALHANLIAIEAWGQAWSARSQLLAFLLRFLKRSEVIFTSPKTEMRPVSMLLPCHPRAVPTAARPQVPQPLLAQPLAQPLRAPQLVAPVAQPPRPAAFVP